ncbi:hypothetical protein [Amphritea sp. HPY]|uniref:hypothetical protein n=1 Tax=Amphritea sp. HPY TaxID=3421652 RepID=UPI003D7D176F
MDIKDLDILEALANGTNPVSGEQLPPHSPYNSPEVIRALFSCINHIRHPPKKEKMTPEQRQAENLANGHPRNAGLPWNDETRTALANKFSQSTNVQTLTEQFERTRGSIISELRRQGLITEEDSRKL